MGLIIFALLIIWLICLVVIRGLIADYLEERGHKANFYLFNFIFGKYLQQYKEETLKESGKIGKLYYIHIALIVLPFLIIFIAVAFFQL